MIVEGRLSGTHVGPFAGLAPSGQRIDVPSVAIFEFEEDRLLCEKVYYDFATILGQVGALPESAGA